MEQLHEYAKHLEDRIEDLTEINKVEIRGVPEREVKVSVDLYQLEALQLNFDDIANALRSENLTMSGGEVLTDGSAPQRARDRRVQGHGADPEHRGEERRASARCACATSPTVTFGFKEPESFAREYGKSVVMLDVIKRAGENLLDASDKINAIIKEDHGTVHCPRTSPSPSPATRAITRA
jgi:multidrug efflux pump